jgi:hypothetical protein
MAELPNCEAVLAQFNQLMEELLSGHMDRSAFQGWEMEILLDIERCGLSKSTWDKLLRRYQRAVQRHLENGARLPLKFSEFLGTVKARKPQRKPAASERFADFRFKTATH